jgi:hypothetical protein
MFFVLILLVIAFATILRIETYGMKALLPKLIIAALLINFSLVLAGTIIDFSQVVTHFFHDQVKGEFGISAQIAKIANIQKSVEINSEADIATKLATGTAGIFMLIFSIFLGITLIFCAGLVLIFGAFFLIVRLITLWILLILAPLAWFLWILPATAHLFRQWWNTFLKWTFFAPIYVFFVYLAIKAGEGGSFASLVKTETQTILDKSGFKDVLVASLLAQPRLLIQCIVIIGILFGGLIVAQKMGVYGAQGAMGMAKFFGKGAAGYASRRLAGYKIPLAGTAGKMLSKFGEKMAGVRGFKGLGARLQTGGDILAETKARGVLSPGAWKRAWPARRAETEARAYARPTGAIRDQLNYALSVGKERTRFGEEGEQAEVNRRKKEIAETGRGTEFLLEGLEKSMTGKNKIDTSAYLRLLFEQNDQNEIIKQSKALGAKYGHVVSDENVTDMTYETLKKAGFTEEQQAKIAMDLGNAAFASGNYMNYGMGKYNEKTRRFEKQPDIKTQREAAAGKASNIEPQTKCRNWHWNTIMEDVPQSKEYPDGVKDLHEGGKELLRHITASEVSQLDRTRPDFVAKVGGEKAVGQIRKFADEVEKTDAVQGGLIKKFAAQLHVLRTGQRADWYNEKKYGELKVKGTSKTEAAEGPSARPSNK